MSARTPPASTAVLGPRLCGIELGGTKCVCVLGTEDGHIEAQQVLSTGTDARATLERIAEVVRTFERFHAIDAIGLASFGPIEMRRTSPAYGRIGRTPKAGWSGIPLLDWFQQRFSRPIGLATDVLGAALAEGRWGAARGLTDFAYVTVGTGVGAGVISGGRPLLGCHHPEMGHVRPARSPGDTWPGSCPFHGGCIEGLVSGPAIEARTGAPPASLPPDHAVWGPVSEVLAQLIHTLVMSLGPERILIGGGVTNSQQHLFPRIRALALRSMAAYLDLPSVPDGFNEFIRPPGLGDHAGPLGALALAADARNGTSPSDSDRNCRTR